MSVSPLLVVSILPDGSTWCSGREGMTLVGGGPCRIKTDARNLAEIIFIALVIF